MKSRTILCYIQKVIGITVMVLYFALGMADTSYAYTSHTREEAVSWATSQLNKSLDYDGVYGAQCVDLIKYYYQYLGVGNTYGNAIDYASNSLPGGWKRVYGGYQPGDIAVWKANHSCSTCKTGGYGHVGIITSADTTGFNAVNQNFNSKSYCTQNWFYCSALTCAIRPDFKAADTVKPSVTNAKITNVDKNGYTVTCNVSDNVGVTKVLFPSWNTGKHTGNDANWIQGSVSGNTATCRINLSALKSGAVEGNYMTHIYAYDAAGNSSCISAGSIFIDRTAPKITDVKLITTDSQGYLVECKVTDKSGINRVQCPTWTIKNGQDDIAKDWETNTAVTAYLCSTGIYRFRVNRSAHNNEYGAYLTHIYAYDTYGNSCGNTGVGAVSINSSVLPKKILRYGDQLLSIYDENMNWSDMKTFAAKMKSQLVTIKDKDKQIAIQELLKDRLRPYYYIGNWQIGKGTSWQWLSGESFSYTNWAFGQPDCAGNNEFYGSVITASGQWNDLPANYNNAGFIVETPLDMKADVSFEYNDRIYSYYEAELSEPLAKQFCEENGGIFIGLSGIKDSELVPEQIKNLFSKYNTGLGFLGIFPVADDKEKSEQSSNADSIEEWEESEGNEEGEDETYEEEELEIGKAKIRSIKNQKTRKLKISVRSTQDADYYQYVVSTNRAFAKNKKTISTYSRTGTFKKLKKKTYYVRVRGFAYEKGEKKYGEWSTVKKIKIKK